MAVRARSLLRTEKIEKNYRAIYQTPVPQRRLDFFDYSWNAGHDYDKNIYTYL